MKLEESAIDQSHVPLEPRPVRSLVCHRDVGYALFCLDSLRRNSQEPLTLVIHDDGSLTSEDQELLRTSLSAEIVSRRQADETMNEKLRTRRHSAAFRSQNPLALKLLDVVLMDKIGRAHV